MKPKLYLDTSIPSAPFDHTKPMRIHITEGWFRHEAQKFDLYTSTLTLIELQAWTNEEKRHKALEILTKHEVTILNMNEIIEALALEYIQKGAFPISEMDDARHIACATHYEIPNIASWDFKHIVSVNPILKIREIHGKTSRLTLTIGTLALFGGDAYGTFEPEKFVKDKDKIY